MSYRVNKRPKFKMSANETGRPVRSPLCIPTTRCPKCIDMIADHRSIKPEHIVDVIGRDGKVRHYVTIWDIFTCDPDDEPDVIEIVAPRGVD